MDTLEIVKRNRVAIENNKFMLKELADLIKDYPNDKQFQNNILTKARNINNDIKIMEAENNRIFAAIELIPSEKIKKYFHMLYVDDMTRKEIALACNLQEYYVRKVLWQYKQLLESILSGGGV